MAILEIKNLSKVYSSGHTAVKAVDNVSLSVEKGEIVLIMGPSGSGKTTLITMAGALLRPTSGEIHINGENISQNYIASQIPGFRNIFTLTEDLSTPETATQNLKFRFWFTPKEMKLVKSSAGDAFVFEEN